MMAKAARKRKKSPLEIVEQLRLARFLDQWEGTSGYWFHPPNGGWRGTKTGEWLYKMGAKPGVPDVIIVKPCVYRGEYYTACAIELKRSDAPEKAVSPRQRQWLGKLSHAGWLATWTRGATEAIKLVREWYPAGLPMPPPRSSIASRKALAEKMLSYPDTRALSDSRIGLITGYHRHKVKLLRTATACNEAEEGLSVQSLDTLLMKIIGRQRETPGDDQ